MSSSDPTASRPTADESNLAALAHASILLSLLMPGLGIIAALVIYATQKDRSAYVTKQSLQATIFQMILAIGPIIVLLLGMLILMPVFIIAAIAGDAAAAGVGILAALGLILLGVVVVAGFVYALYGAYRTYHGRSFRYPFVSSMMDRT